MRNRSQSSKEMQPRWWPSPSLLATGYWLLASGFWLLASGFWLLEWSCGARVPRRERRKSVESVKSVLNPVHSVHDVTMPRRARTARCESGTQSGVVSSGELEPIEDRACHKRDHRLVASCDVSGLATGADDETRRVASRNRAPTSPRRATCNFSRMLCT